MMMVAPSPCNAVGGRAMMVADADMYADTADVGSNANTGVCSRSANQGQSK